MSVQITDIIDMYDGTILAGVIQFEVIQSAEPTELPYYIHFCKYDFENNEPVYFCKELRENDLFYLKEGLIPVRDFLTSTASPLTIIRLREGCSQSEQPEQTRVPDPEDYECLPEEGVRLN